MFLTFLVVLMLAASLPIVLFSGGEMVGLTGLMVPGTNVAGRPAERAMGCARTLIQSYIWVGWGAFCAAEALRYASQPGVTNPWAYYATTLLVTSAPIAYLHRRDRMSACSDDERRTLQRGTNLWRVILLFVCMTFLVAPQLMSMPYGWFTRVERQIAGDSTHAMTTELHRVQEQIVPSTANGQTRAPEATHPVLADTPRMVTTGRAIGERDAAAAGEGPCEQEQPADRGPDGAGTANGPCVMPAESE
jgi:hypothetical protein